ncbi:MAG: endonuclease/exonuclease/phosphatase family protein [Chitinophagaceae bacterium]
MATRFRLFTKRFFIFLNAVLVFFFLLACVAPYLDPENWWFISFLGLGFPFLLAAMLCFLIGWLFVKRKLALLPAIALVLGYKSISVLFAFHPGASFKEKKQPGDIRVVTWNVARFVEMKRNNNKGSRTRLRMMEQLKDADADIICMQEFFHSNATGWYSNLTYIAKQMNYPYFYYSHDDDGDKHFIGNIIFSRFPIIDSGLVRFPRPSLPETLMHADIVAYGDTMRVYTTHLQSLQLRPDDYEAIDHIKEGDSGIISNSRTIYSKLRKGISRRKLQTDVVEQVVGDSPYPAVLCGDLNDVPNSYTYYSVRGDKQDVFLKKGFGIGRTFSAISPTLRIDYMFADKNFTVKQVKRVVRDYSDHYMLVSDLHRRKETP